MRSVHVIPGVWTPVVGYDGLVDWLRREFTLTLWDRSMPERPANLVEFPYDWRLSCRFNGARLAREIMPILARWRREKNADARLILLCHSMGGLVARQFLERCDGADDCRLLITMGTPFRGSLAALVSAVNGLPGGRLATGLTRMARSLPSLYELAPQYACLNGVDGLRYPLEAELPLAQAQQSLLRAGASFHEEINASVRRRDGTAYAVVPLQGTRQPTPTTAALTGTGRLEAYTGIDGYEEGGDGRVARLSGRPMELSDMDPAQAGFPDRGYPEGHGALPDSKVIRELIWQVLTAKKRFHRGAEAADELGVAVPELVDLGGDVPVEVIAPVEADRLAVQATMRPADSPPGAPGRARTLTNRGQGRYATTFAGLAEGMYELTVRAANGAYPVTRHVLVWSEDD
jgi:pimeloyl-ACP methyl ester carboxylesterase